MGSRSADPPPSGGVAAIVLAAGRSRRMGRPKQLLPLDDGQTVIEIVVSRLRPHVDSVVVVIGHVAGQVAAVLAAQQVTLAINDEVDRGMLSSVQCGLRTAGAGWDGYLVCLGDQPGLGAGVVVAVLAAAQGGGKGIVIPTFGGRRGHPVFLSNAYYDDVLQLPEGHGLNAITRSHPEDTLEVPVAEAAVLEDLDTPADYARERARLAEPEGR